MPKTMNLDDKHLTSVLCHDLRGPLNLIRDVVGDMRQNDGLRPRSLDHLDIAVMVMDHTLRNVAVLNRDVLHRQVGVVPSRRFERVVREVCRVVRLRYLHDVGDIRLDLSFDPTLFPQQLAIDVDLFETCMMNLLDNAFRYSRSDMPVSLSVSMRGQCIHCLITNTLIGPLSDMSQWTQPGWRSDSSRQHSNGLGLGLYVADKICKANDWGLKLSADSGVIFAAIEIPSK